MEPGLHCLLLPVFFAKKKCPGLFFVLYTKMKQLSIISSDSSITENMRVGLITMLLFTYQMRIKLCESSNVRDNQVQNMSRNDFTDKYEPLSTYSKCFAVVRLMVSDKSVNVLIHGECTVQFITALKMSLF